MLVILEHPRGRRILLRARVSDFRRRSRGGASFVASVAGLARTDANRRPVTSHVARRLDRLTRRVRTPRKGG